MWFVKIEEKGSDRSVSNMVTVVPRTQRSSNEGGNISIDISAA